MTEFYLKSTKSYKANGNLESKQTYTYDLNGNLISLKSVNYDFTLFGSTTTYTYNSDNNLISENHSSIYDSNGDGAVDYTSITTYNTNGNPIEFVFESFDEYSNEISIVKTTYTYDANNNLITETFDYDDGIGDIQNTYAYDSNNNLISQTYSNISDDINESIYDYTYDIYGNLISEAFDYFGDGTDAEIYTYAYDDNNNLVSETFDYDGDGVSDSTSTYAYDSNNNLISETHDAFYSGVFENRSTYTYDDRNNLVTQTHDEDGDGIAERTDSYTYTYDENDNLIAQAYDEFSDGVDLQTIHEYVEADLVSNTNDAPQMLLTDVHRLYQFEKGYHLYTSDVNELNHIGEKVGSNELSYNYESAKYQVLADDEDIVTGEEIEGVKPIYRFYNNETGAHLYTMDENEKDSIKANLSNYDFEDIKYYAFESEPENLATIPVYRLLNNQSGAHLFSSDANEIEHLDKNEPHFSIENNGDAAFYVLEI